MKKFSLLLLTLVLFVLAGTSSIAKAQTVEPLLISGGPGGDENAGGKTGRYLEQDVLDLINKERIANNLPPLNWNQKVADMARQHSRDMGWNNYFNHRGLDGKMVTDRAEAFGINWQMIGENIAMVGGFSDPIQHVVEGWMNSPGHRKNILEPRWKESGIGIFINSNGTYYFTQVFVVKD